MALFAIQMPHNLHCCLLALRWSPRQGAKDGKKSSPADAVMVRDEGPVEGPEERLEGGLEEGCEEGLHADLGLRGTDTKALLRAACLMLSCSSAASAAGDKVRAKVRLRSVDPANGACLLVGSFSTGE